MVERLYLRDLLGFDEAELEFAPGLNVFTGPSGAGKSVLISALLGSFGIESTAAPSLCEVTLRRPESLQSEAFALDEEIVLKTIKKERLRRFIDAQSISAKALRELFSPYVRYLSVRDKGEFAPSQLLAYIDEVASQQEKGFAKRKKGFTKRFKRYKEKRERYEALLQMRRDKLDRAAFSRFDIEKIESVAPKVGELEALLEQKRTLSLIEKLREAADKASQLFRFEDAIARFYELSGRSSTTVDEALMQLKSDIAEVLEECEALEETDPEALLDRIAELNDLVRRYGSIEATLEALEQKRAELESIEHSDEEITLLERFLESETRELTVEAHALRELRIGYAEKIAERCNAYLGRLKLPELSFSFQEGELSETGIDLPVLRISQRSVSQLSGGEYNRLRLALLSAVATLGARSENGIVVLDEIDANVSGDESIAVAELVKLLSQQLQIFAISHQPHLSAVADRHFLVSKEEERSVVNALDAEARIAEIARIVGGERADKEAFDFAQKMVSSFYQEN